MRGQSSFPPVCAGVDDPVVWIEGASATAGLKRWLYADHQGSVIAAAGAGAAPSQINRYDEYGRPDPANLGRFQYTGQAWIPELGLYHYKARVYDPALGRFLQTDPIGYDDQINLYAYVGNDPVNFVDPEGEQRRRIGPAPRDPLVHSLAQVQLAGIRRTLPDYQPGPVWKNQGSGYSASQFVEFKGMNRALDQVGRSNFTGRASDGAPSSAFGQILTGSSSLSRTGRAEYQFMTGRSSSSAGSDFASLMQGGGGARTYPNGAQTFSRGLGDGLSVNYTMRTDSAGGTTIEAQFTQSTVTTGSRISRNEIIFRVKVRYDRLEE